MLRRFPLLLAAACLCALLAAPTPAAAQTARPIPILFDTDMGNDVDDALALAMLHAFADRGEVDLLAVTLTKDNPFAAPYIDLVNTFYNRPDLPVGVARSGVTPEDNPMIRTPAERRNPQGGFLYPRDLTHEAAPAAVAVLRRALAGAADTSVVVVQVGFSTNLARLLESPPDAVSPLSGRDLVRRKVRLLSLMFGDYAYYMEGAEYNVKMDIAAGQKLMASWPTPAVASGFEIGASLMYPAAAIESAFGYAPHHPVVDAYRAYMKMPYDRPTWDLTSVLYAVRPNGGYFDLSGPGTISVDDNGYTSFRRSEGGRHRYLKLSSDAQRARTLEALIWLSSQPPMPRR